MLFNPPSRPLCGGRGSCGRFLDWHLQHYTKPIDRRSRRNGCKSSVGVALSEEGVLLFVFPYREPKEDGGRNATDCGRPFAKRRFGKQWCEVLAVSLALWQLRDR